MFVMESDSLYRLEVSGCSFSYAHILGFYDGKCCNLHGHEGIVNVVVYGRMNGEFVIDFGVLKQIVRDVVGELDHKFLLGMNDCKFYEEGRGMIRIFYGDGRELYLRRKEVVVVGKYSTAECIVEYILDRIVEKIRENGFRNVVKVGVEFSEGYKNKVYLERVM